MSDELIAGLGGALLGAMIAGFTAWWVHREQQITALKEELRQALSMLLDLQEQYQDRILKIPDAQLRETAAKQLNSKRTMYLEASESIVRRISKHVTTSEYIVLAQELLNDADFLRAERYFKMAVSARGATTIQRIVAIRALGSFYFAHGPSRDIEKASHQFRLAAEQLVNPSDPYSVFTQAITYELWGLNMLQQGFHIEGTQLIDRARKYYEDLPPTYPWRQPSLDLLPQKVAGVLAGQQPTPSSTPTPELQITQHSALTAAAPSDARDAMNSQTGLTP